MALHMIRSTPSFTKAMRGYDIEEVDEYVDALRESEDQHAQELEESEAARRALSDEVARLRDRVAELEGCVRSETPRSIAALGERLTLVLEHAEAGASDAVREAREEADALLADAKKSAEEERLISVARTAEAEQRAAAVLKAAEDRASVLDSTSRRRAESIVAEAEARALARRGEIEAWVERVRSHIENEEIRAAEEFARVRALRAADLADLRARHDQLVAGLVEVGESLQRTVEAARRSVPAEPDGRSDEIAGGNDPAPFDHEVAEVTVDAATTTERGGDAATPGPLTEPGGSAGSAGSAVAANGSSVPANGSSVPANGSDDATGSIEASVAPRLAATPWPEQASS